MTFVKTSINQQRQPSTMNRVRKLGQGMSHIEVDIPILKKFLFVFPLRAGLFFCSFVLLLAITSITIQAVCNYNFRLFNYRLTSFELVQMSAMYIITIIVTLIEIVFALMLLVGTKKQSAKILTWVYCYVTVKTITYGLLLLVCFVVKHVAVSEGEGWFDRNIDPFRKFVLYDSPECGLIDIVMQVYLAIVIRSEVLLLRGDDHRRVFHTATPPVPMAPSPVPYHALPEYIDTNYTYKY